MIRHKLTPTLLAFALLFLLSPLASGQSEPAAPPAADISPEAAQQHPRVLSVASNLVCNCGTCPHIPLHTCTCGNAQRMRYEMAQLLADGKTNPEVISAMVARHGNGLLAEPPDTLGGILAKAIVPVALFLAGGSLVGGIIVRWRRRGAGGGPEGGAGGGGASADEPTDDYLSRVDEELERF